MLGAWSSDGTANEAAGRPLKGDGACRNAVMILSRGGPPSHSQPLTTPFTMHSQSHMDPAFSLAASHDCAETPQKEADRPSNPLPGALDVHLLLCPDFLRQVTATAVIGLIQ